jgi:hypothetical protein
MPLSRVPPKISGIETFFSVLDLDAVAIPGDLVPLLQPGSRFGTQKAHAAAPCRPRWTTNGDASGSRKYLGRKSARSLGPFRLYEPVARASPNPALVLRPPVDEPVPLPPCPAGERDGPHHQAEP